MLIKMNLKQFDYRKEKTAIDSAEKGKSVQKSAAKTEKVAGKKTEPAKTSKQSASPTPFKVYSKKRKLLLRDEDDESDHLETLHDDPVSVSAANRTTEDSNLL
ncbi:hypothetical protein NL676_032036 [Syzygium grande]|nr:hypothetical protein NL676_032036 [Syzygium grande]